MREKKTKQKIQYDPFFVIDFSIKDNNKTHYQKKEYGKIIAYSIIELEKFEKDNGVEIWLFFSHISNELTLNDYHPCNRETERICRLFVDSLEKKVQVYMQQNQ